ncbi:MAG: hypothetical protein Kow0029_07210 [Candidatus Rifleibacteriota bacterium]
MKIQKKLLKILFVFFCFIPFVKLQAQQHKIDHFVNHTEKLIREANELMKEKNTFKAIEKLRDANRYIESVLNQDLEDYLYQARKENPGFKIKIEANLASGFSSQYWQRKYDLANSSLKACKSAISGLASHGTLNKQDIAWAYLKTIYESIKTIKDVVDNVAEQQYWDAINSANEGIEGFIDNYKEIEEAHLQKTQTEMLEVQINGLIRRAKRTIKRLDPVLSFMKANAEEGERYERLIARLEGVTQKIRSGFVKKMVFGDAKYTWNYGPFLKQIKQACSDFRDYEIADSKFENNFNSIMSEAKKSWQTVKSNISSSDDEEQKAQYLQWADEAWEEFEPLAKNEFANALPKKITSPKENKPNLFAGMNNSDANIKKDIAPRKPNLFAGTGNSQESEKSEDENSNYVEQKTNKPQKTNPFAGTGSSDIKPESIPNKTASKSARNQGTKLGSILNNGEGNNRNRGGGTYCSIDLNKTGNKDLFEIAVTSGTFKFVHIHLRNSRGIWFSVYNGTNRIFRIGDLLKGKRNAFTHINICINGQHEKYLPVACTADIILYKAASVPEEIQKRFEAQNLQGTGEIPNEYMANHPSLWLDANKAKISARPKTSGSAKSYRTNSKNRQENTSITKIPPQDSTKNNKNTAQDPANNKKNADKELIDLISKLKSIEQKADKEFNKPYWENGVPKTTMKATNPKASVLAIMKQGIQIAASSKYPENQFALYKKIAIKLIYYSGKVFAFVGKREFFLEAANIINKAGQSLGKAKKDKISMSFLYYEQGELWRGLGKIATPGGHSYNKNACYKLEIAAYEKALSLYPENFEAKRALKR